MSKKAFIWIQAIFTGQAIGLALCGFFAGNLVVGLIEAGLALVYVAITYTWLQLERVLGSV